MSRLIATFGVTIIIGFALFLAITFFFKKDETSEQNGVSFDISYVSQIKIDELIEIIASEEEVILLVGNSLEEATIKVSNILKNMGNLDDLNIYYLEKTDDIVKSSYYTDIILQYPELNNYLNFTPVILVFRANNLVAGLPGEIEQRNLRQFFLYTDVI